MIQLRVTVQIDQPVAKVYTFLSQYENDPLWRTGVISMQQSKPGSAQVGMQTWEVMQFWGTQMTTIARVIASEPNRQTAFESIKGPVKAWGKRLFEAQENSTYFTYVLNLEPVGFMSLASPIIRYLFQRQLEKDIISLKKQLEASN